jgi:hypothetical protein
VSCTSCGTTFAALANINTKGRAQWLDQQEPGCRCQRISISEHSPGPVDDTEILIRIVIAPYHVHPKTGSPKASALTHAESIGMSLFREGRATDNEIRAAAEQIIRNARAAALKQGKTKRKTSVFMASSA